MREAIVRLISELELISLEHGRKYTDKWNDDRQYHLGAEAGLDLAIEKLEEVLARETGDTGNVAEPE